MRRRLAVLDAPSNLGLRPPRAGAEPGVRGMARALRRAGLLARLGAEDAGEVPAPPYAPDLDPALGVRNGAAIRRYSGALAARLGELLGAGVFPVVLGGDCSILLGTMLALRRRGRHGLVFLDGHTDFGLPETSATGGAAGMDLALATGRGPALLADLDGLGPLVRDEDVVVLGHRDAPDPARYRWRAIFDTPIRRHDLAALRRDGIDRTVAGVLGELAARRLDGFWIHVDLDVLDSELMPAVDSPQPDGLTWDELRSVLRPLLASALATGVQFTIFDPDLDPTGRHARALAAAIAAAFDRPSAGAPTGR
jgi:arginase